MRFMKKAFILFIVLILSFCVLSSCNETLTVSFDTDGGTIVEDIKIRPGEYLVKPKAPIKEDLYFVGWFLDDELFDFANPIESSITLKAKWNIAPDEKLDEASCYLDLYQDYERFEYLRNRLAKASYLYDISPFEISEQLKLTDECINKLIEEDTLEVFLSYYLYFVDITLELSIATSIDYNLALSNDLITKAASNYQLLKSSGYYQSDYENFLDDNRYTGFILPVIFASLTNGNKYNDIQIWLSDAVKNTYLEYFDVEINQDSISFSNKITQSIYKFNYQELTNLIDAYNLISSNEQTVLAINYRMVYKKYILNVNQENTLDILINNDEQIEQIIQNELPTVIDNIKKINATKNIIKGLKDKFDSLTEEFSSYANKDDLILAITNAINFKDQVISELESILPKLDVLLDLKDIYDALGLKNYIDVNQSNIVANLNLDVVNNYYNEVVELLKNVMVVLKNFNADNYNIDIIAETILNEDYDNDLFKEEITKFEDSIYEIISKSDLLDMTIYEVIDILDVVSSLKGICVTNLQKIIFGDKLNDELLDELMLLLNEASFDYTKEDIQNIINLISVFINKKTDLTFNEIDTYLVTIEKITNILTKDMLVLLKDCLVEIVYVEYKTISKDEAKLLVDTVISDFAGFMEYLKIILHNYLINNALTYTVYQDLPYSKRTVQIVIKQFEYLDKIIDENNLSLLNQFLSKISDVSSIYEINSDILSDLDNQVNQCLNILKSNTSYTKEQKDFINETSRIFLIVKIY